MGINGKLSNLEENHEFTHKAWDSLIFNDVKEVLGGRIWLIIVGSAPISKDVLDYLKVAFCCPIIEAYGMTEVTGPSTCQYLSDTSSGNVGGPVCCTEIKLIDVPEMNYYANGE